jgi:hypothetical protein
MTNKEMREMSIAVLVAVAVTWCAATSDYSPIKPRPDRPVLRFIQRLARAGLWVMWLADAPRSAEPQYAARIDASGQPIVNHRHGW